MTGIQPGRLLRQGLGALKSRLRPGCLQLPRLQRLGQGGAVRLPLQTPADDPLGERVRLPGQGRCVLRIARQYPLIKAQGCFIVRARVLGIKTVRAIEQRTGLVRLGGHGRGDVRRLAQDHTGPDQQNHQHRRRGQQDRCAHSRARLGLRLHTRAQGRHRHDQTIAAP